MNRRATALLALILLAVLGFMLWPGEDRPGPEANVPGLGAARSKPVHGSSGTAGIPSKLPRDRRSGTLHATHSPEELKDFIIPVFTTEDATIGAALDSLIGQYNEICRNTGETPLRFTYRIDGEPAGRLDLHLSQTSFLRALRIIAARSGLVLERDGTSLVFSSMVQEPAGSLVTRTSAVPPTFLSDLNALLSDAGPGAEDPFSAPAPSLPPRERLIDQLRDLGIVRSTDATATYLPGSSTLVVKGSADDQARLNAFLDDEFLNRTPVMLKTTTKLIESAEPIRFEKTHFSEEEYQEVMRSLAQTQGVDIMTQPSVTSRPGQNATIEIIREVLRPDPGNDGQINEDWTGVRTQVNSGGYGFDLQSRIANETRVALGGTPDTIKGVTADASQHHPSGHTVLIASTTPEGAPLYIFATTQRVDATGRPYDPRDPQE